MFFRVFHCYKAEVEKEEEEVSSLNLSKISNYFIEFNSSILSMKLT